MYRRQFLIGSAMVGSSVLIAQKSNAEMSPLSVPRHPLTQESSNLLQSAPSAASDILFRKPPRSSFAHIVTPDSIYIVGGHINDFHIYTKDHMINETLVYDRKTTTWKLLRPHPELIQGHRGVAYGSYIYTFGGFRYEPALDFTNHPRQRGRCDPPPESGCDEMKWWARTDERVFRYSIASDKWEVVAHMPRRRSSNELILYKDKVYLIGGWDGTPRQRGDTEGTGFNKMIDVFDLHSETFVPNPQNIQTPLRRALTSAVWNSKLVMFGGRAPSCSIQNVTVFDPETNGFDDNIFPQFPTELFSGGACFTGDIFVVAGGQPGHALPVNTIYTLKPGEEEWKKSKASLSKPAMFVELIPLSPTKVLAIGGHEWTQASQKPIGLWEEIDIAD